MMPAPLSWISDADLKAICENIINKARAKAAGLDYGNIVDPFSALFDISINNISYDEWAKHEIMRQRQKSLQNTIGTFHQEVLGKIAGWENLGTGEIVDLQNRDKKIIVEVKNKFNTTKGNHKTQIYRDFKTYLSKLEYKDFTAYYVPILSHGRFDKPFTPSDNNTSKRLPENQFIRETDGKTFYALATGSPTALCDLYNHLPRILEKITSVKATDIKKAPLFKKLIREALK